MGESIRVRHAPAVFPPARWTEIDLVESILSTGEVFTYRDHLPAPLSSFIGRQREIAEVNRLLSEHRLVTLTGPGGCGKTRLAIHVANELRPMVAEGVYFIELASLVDPALLLQVVAASMGVREEAGQSLSESFLNYLQDRRALLLLDNCEHLIEACARLCEWILVNCPEVRLLTTSREVLKTQGEVVWVVPSLSLPEPKPWKSPNSETDSLQAYRQSEAVQLFVARAVGNQASFTLTRQNAPWVAEICRRLDGLPLAIELAAARVRAFSVRQIHDRLDDRFRLLNSGLRSGTPRHQTLEATLDWSHSLLPENEQIVFRRLSVFSGGWTLEAAEAVCASESEEIDGMAALANLVDKSLVVVDRSPGYSRYHFLETIREYARQRLAQTADVDETRNRHLDYFMNWAEEAAVHLGGPEQAVWIGHFDREHDNLRSALDWSLRSEERAAKGVSLAGACGHFWRLRGLFREGRARLSAALDHPGAQSKTQKRARAVLWGANLAYLQSEFQAAQTLAEEGLSISREIGEAGQANEAKALDLLGELCTEVGDYEAAPGYFHQALEIYREIQDQSGTADLLMQLGWAAMRAGDYEEAYQRLDECLALFRDMGKSALLGLALAGMGELAIRQGRLDRAKTLLAESLELRRQLGDQWGIAAALGSLGWVALLQRDFPRMRTLLHESVMIRMGIGEKGGLAWCLEKLAEAAQMNGQSLPMHLRWKEYRRAVRIFSAAAAIRSSVDSVIDPADQPAYDQTLALLRESIGEEDFAEAWAAGSRLSLQEAIDQALTDPLSPDEALSLSDQQAAKAQYGGLSRREREVAAWIAQGKTNREIAEIMVVRTKTVETYITRILNKFGFNSRVQIATWALEAGLPKPDRDEA